MDTKDRIEIAKVVVDALVPLSIALIGWFLHGRLQAIEKRVDSLFEVQKLRVGCFAEMMPLVNDIFCFSTYVGHWKEMNPPEIIQNKRQLDATFFRNLFLWTPDLIEAYQEFMKACFATFQGPDSEAKTRANLDRHLVARKEAWDAGWNALFVSVDHRSERKFVQLAYATLTRSMARSIGHEVPTRVLETLVTPAKT